MSSTAKVEGHTQLPPVGVAFPPTSPFVGIVAPHRELLQIRDEVSNHRETPISLTWTIGFFFLAGALSAGFALFGYYATNGPFSPPKWEEIGLWAIAVSGTLLACLCFGYGIWFRRIEGGWRERVVARLDAIIYKPRNPVNLGALAQQARQAQQLQQGQAPDQPQPATGHADQTASGV